MDLSKFVPGSIYDVGTSLGNYLFAEGSAEPVADAPSVERLTSLQGDRAEDRAPHPGKKR